MTSINKFSTFAITFRPRDGVTEEHISLFTNFVKKTSDYYYIITEKEDDERHIHSAVVTKTPLARSNVCQRLKQLFKGLDPEEYAVLFKGVKILYSDDFITKYMDKDDDTVVIERNLPESASLEAFYPPKPSVGPVNRRLQYHHQMEELEKLWHQFVPPHYDVNTMNRS